EAPAVLAFATIRNVLLRIVKRNCFPQPGRLKRLHTFTAEVFNEKSADEHCRVAHSLRINSKTRTAREKTILWIFGEQRRRNLRRLPIRRGHNDEFLHSFHVPAS